MSARRRRVLTVALVVTIALAPMGVAVAQSLTHAATAGTTYQTNSGVTVTLGDDRDVAAVPFANDTTYQDGDLTVSGSDAAVEVDDTTYTQSPLTVRQVSVTGEVTVARSDLNQTLTVTDGSANVIQLREPTVGDDTQDLAYDSDTGFTVRLEGFDPVGIAAVDAGTGEPLATAAVGQDGVAEFELPAGQRNVRLKTTPSELQVRNEAKPSELIDGNATLRARLFPEGGEVVQREVTNGTVSLDGLPLDERIVITVREENADFTYRRILIESAIQTSEIYLLPTNEPSAEVRFQIQDETGRFDSQNTRFFVEKPINRDFDNDGSNETQYQVISGDRVGADAEFPTILVDSERYRLRVENDAGEQRVLGSYTVQGATVTTVPIGEVQFTADVDSQPALQTSLRDAPDSASYDHEVRLVYLDPAGNTSEIDVAITNSTGATIRPESTEQLNGTDSAYVETYPITDPDWNPETNTATVSVTAERGFDQLTFEQTLGDLPDVLGDGAIDTQVMELIGLVSIVAVVGLVVIASPQLAALIGPGYAGLLTLIGIVPIPMPAVVLAGLVGVMINVGTAAGRL
jgi:hypothetical protein